MPSNFNQVEVNPRAGAPALLLNGLRVYVGTGDPNGLTLDDPVVGSAFFDDGAASALWRYDGAAWVATGGAGVDTFAALTDTDVTTRPLAVGHLTAWDGAAWSNAQPIAHSVSRSDGLGNVTLTLDSTVGFGNTITGGATSDLGLYGDRVRLGVTSSLGSSGLFDLREIIDGTGDVLADLVANRIAIGGAFASADGAIAIGAAASADGQNTAVGPRTQAKGPETVAVGVDVATSGNNAVAVGLGTWTGASNVVSVGHGFANLQVQPNGTVRVAGDAAAAGSGATDEGTLTVRPAVGATHLTAHFPVQETGLTSATQGSAPYSTAPVGAWCFGEEAGTAYLYYRASGGWRRVALAAF